MVADNQINTKARCFFNSRLLDIKTHQNAPHRRVRVTNLQADIVPVFGQTGRRNMVDQADNICHAGYIFLSHCHPTKRLLSKKKECTGSPVHSGLTFWFLVLTYSAELISSSDLTVAEPGG